MKTKNKHRIEAGLKGGINKMDLMGVFKMEVWMKTMDFELE